MNRVDQNERLTQNRVVRLFVDELGYKYLGNWQDRPNNSNIEETLLSGYLKEAGYSQVQISRAIHILKNEANNFSRTLYANNEAVYSKLRFGVGVKEDQGQNEETVALINWKEPEKNHFAIAEEVTLKGNHERRPDVVLYVNGIAFGVLELKRSSVTIGDGIRQAISNQQREFNEWFYSTVQWVMAGNDSEGLQYGTIKTEEKYFLRWKEDEKDDSRLKLDKYLLKLFEKNRTLEIIKDFIVFDAGIKKLPRPHQFIAVKLAQEKAKRREGGIIWHTQGSGKSIVMVLLAKWILENNPNARICIITDRDELDKQIQSVFAGVGERIHRTSSANNLIQTLKDPSVRLMCTLIHKFGPRNVDDFDAFIKQLESQPRIAVGEVFVFVDECHRTQGGKLHKSMKAILPSGVFVGFTGTPLLRQDRQTTMEVFGSYIHTYKFSEAVEDQVVLDLVYEARDIDQELTSPDKVDAWFEAKTRGLNNWQRNELKKKWATMQNVLSSKSRMERVVEDISFDFVTKPRLSSERGNAILVASSIYEASKYYELFQKTEFKGRCAIITSYNPQTRDITLEDTGANTETDKEFIYNIYTELLRDVVAASGKTKTETYEDESKRRFIKEPANMRLLIVVDKLLTGFDSPPCSYLYIDKSMQDHGLFQAICRTNRLDGEDKPFGFIVDYKNLFQKVEDAISVYTSPLDDSTGGASPEVLIKDRLAVGKQALDEALEQVSVLCEPVEPPRGDKEFIRYFCGNTEIPTDLEEREPLRGALYKGTAELLRAFANIADDLEQAGYSSTRASWVKNQVEFFTKVREVVRKASGEQIDLKAYEADMRVLIDRYIKADEPRKISDFDDIPLVELIVKSGIDKAAEALEGGLQGDHEAVAETIENNVRSTIVKEQTADPIFYAKMSAVLLEIIHLRKTKAISYEEYLRRIGEVVRNVVAGAESDTPKTINTSGKKALYNNLHKNESLSLKVHESISTYRPDSWRGSPQKERVVKKAIFDVLQDPDQVDRIFDVVVKHSEY